MAAVQSQSIPTVKVESDQNGVKQEDEDVDMPSPYMDDDADDETPDLDFKQAQQQIWLSHVPKALWEAWSKLSEDAEIEIGTLRVEGPEANPSRVSFMLNQLPQHTNQHKEYNLFPTPISRRKSQKPGQAFVFSEKNKKGYQARKFQWDEVDEEGNPGQGRSSLYENHKRAQRRKENRGRFTPYFRRTVPKETAVSGMVSREFEMTPVKNEQFSAIETSLTESSLKIPDKRQAQLVKDKRVGQIEPTMTQLERQRDLKARQAQKQVMKDNRTSRMPKEQLIEEILRLFKQYRIWGLSQIRGRVRQPEGYLRSVLQEIAFMHTRGDFNGKWELNDEYKQNEEFLKSEMEAPRVESDLERSGLEDNDEDEDENFENVDM